MKPRTLASILAGTVAAAGLVVFLAKGCEGTHARRPVTNPMMTEGIAAAHRKVILDNASKIAEDIAFILKAMDKTTKWYGFMEEDIKEDFFAKDITEAIGKGGLQYRECRYVSLGDCSAGYEEYKGWTSGMIECYDPGTHDDLGAYWLRYEPPVDNQRPGESLHVSFEIMVKNGEIKLFFLANPSPIYDAPNFECLPRTYRQ